MAKMIPPHRHEKTPASEQRVFNLLRNDPATADWVVLHSLNLKQSGTQPYGEVDFVVFIPAAGVFCLEVKGGRVVCRDGTWTSTDASGQTYTLKRSPFKQAQDGMHEVRAALEERLAKAPAFYRIAFGYAVVFTDVEAPPADIGTEPWEVIDYHGLNAGLSGLLLRAAKQQRTRLGIRSSPPEPQPALLKQIRDALRPDFDRIVARGTLVSDSERRLLSLTEEQYEVLDLLADNLRCLFEGAAGTGKTLLALEYARRIARSGHRVLLVCFNRLLGDGRSAGSAQACSVEDTGCLGQGRAERGTVGVLRGFPSPGDIRCRRSCESSPGARPCLHILRACHTPSELPQYSENRGGNGTSFRLRVPAIPDGAG